MRKNVSSILKIGVSLIGLAYVVWKVPLQEVGQLLVGLEWKWVIVAFALVTISLVLRAYRWLLLLRGLDSAIRFGRLVELYFVGNFFNAFLPSGFGGDAVRALEAARDVPANIAAGTVIVDRLTGLLMLFIMALIVLPFRPADFPDELALAIIALCVTGLIGGFVLLNGRLIIRLGAWLPGPLSPEGSGPVAKFLQAVQGCGWRAIASALGVSAVFNLLLAGWWAACGRALGLSIPYTYYLLVVPILSVILLVPSIGGLGVRESLAPTLFVGAGLSSTGAEAVAISLLVFIVMRMASLLGAPVYIMSTLRENRQQSAEVR
jgi:uncharacterized membrane protein YbhN (UPF0104 family)